MQQDPGVRSSDPTKDSHRPDLECPGVSHGGIGQGWPAAGLGALSVAVHAWDLLKEVAIILLPHDSFLFSRSVVSDSLRPHGLYPTRLLHPWDFPDWSRLPFPYLGPNYGGGNEDNEDNGDLPLKIPCMYCHTQCSQPCSRPPPTHASAGDSHTQRQVQDSLLWRCRSAVVCRRGRGSGCSRLGYGISPLGGGHH